MTDIVRNFITVLKSKPPKEYNIHELDVFIDEIICLYRYSFNVEDTDELVSIYKKITEFANLLWKGAKKYNTDIHHQDKLKKENEKILTKLGLLK